MRAPFIKYWDVPTINGHVRLRRGDRLYQQGAMIEQGVFDQCVRDYNEDYKLLLTRASLGHYNCLIISFMILKDLDNLINTIYDSAEVKYHILIYPFTFRGNDVLLRQLGFDGPGIANIYGFLGHVKQTQGMGLEECLERGAVALCSSLR